MLCLQQGVQKAQREQQLTVFAQALAAGLQLSGRREPLVASVPSLFLGITPDWFCSRFCLSCRHHAYLGAEIYERTN